ncbi:uncharacterized protein LOC101453041 isoform X1 [Ceratitis capitata]|uniref:Uncharacterized protein n=2 Tax=Ceratitis capitata TaxID=7213 RepID=W8C3R2_CERCA|nr:uncharacterized protein LOC101453041 isoform X1 [Ceratitis capitata]
MFTSNKRNNFATLGAKIPNSRQQFVATLNGSFDTAERVFNKNYTSSKVLKQTKLNYDTLIKRTKIENENNNTVGIARKYEQPEYFLLPPLQPKKVAPIDNTNRTNNVTAKDSQDYFTDDRGTIYTAKDPTNNPLLLKKGRNKITLIGQVDFCLKMYKLHPTLDALWDIYGQLRKVTKGKQRGENILLLRNHNGGPVLQSIYYDFALNAFETGSYVRAVGRFIGGNRLHTFKLQKLCEEDYKKWIQHFTRMQNVSSFVLL